MEPPGRPTGAAPGADPLPTEVRAVAGRQSLYTGRSGSDPCKDLLGVSDFKLIKLVTNDYCDYCERS